MPTRIPRIHVLGVTKPGLFIAHALARAHKAEVTLLLPDDRALADWNEKRAIDVTTTSTTTTDAQYDFEVDKLAVGPDGSAFGDEIENLVVATRPHQMAEAVEAMSSLFQKTTRIVLANAGTGAIRQTAKALNRHRGELGHVKFTGKPKLYGAISTHHLTRTGPFSITHHIPSLPPTTRHSTTKHLNLHLKDIHKNTKYSPKTPPNPAGELILGEWSCVNSTLELQASVPSPNNPLMEALYSSPPVNLRLADVSTASHAQNIYIATNAIIDVVTSIFSIPLAPLIDPINHPKVHSMVQALCAELSHIAHALAPRPKTGLYSPKAIYEAVKKEVERDPERISPMLRDLRHGRQTELEIGMAYFVEYAIGVRVDTGGRLCDAICNIVRKRATLGLGEKQLRRAVTEQFDVPAFVRARETPEQWRSRRRKDKEQEKEDMELDRWIEMVKKVVARESREFAEMLGVLRDWENMRRVREEEEEKEKGDGKVELGTAMKVEKAMKPGVESKTDTKDEESAATTTTIEEHGHNDSGGSGKSAHKPILTDWGEISHQNYLINQSRSPNCLKTVSSLVSADDTKPSQRAAYARQVSRIQDLAAKTKRFLLSGGARTSTGKEVSEIYAISLWREDINARVLQEKKKYEEKRSVEKQRIAQEAQVVSWVRVEGGGGGLTAVVGKGGEGGSARLTSGNPASWTLKEEEGKTGEEAGVDGGGNGEEQQKKEGGKRRKRNQMSLGPINHTNAQLGRIKSDIRNFEQRPTYSYSLSDNSRSASRLKAMQQIEVFLKDKKPDDRAGTSVLTIAAEGMDAKDRWRKKRTDGADVDHHMSSLPAGDFIVANGGERPVEGWTPLPTQKTLDGIAPIPGGDWKAHKGLGSSDYRDRDLNNPPNSGLGNPLDRYHTGFHDRGRTGLNSLIRTTNIAGSTEDQPRHSQYKKSGDWRKNLSDLYPPPRPADQAPKKKGGPRPSPPQPTQLSAYGTGPGRRIGDHRRTAPVPTVASAVAMAQRESRRDGLNSSDRVSDVSARFGETAEIARGSRHPGAQRIPRFGKKWHGQST